MYIVDRIEDGIAIMEDIKNKSMIEIDISLLPEEVKESSVLEYCNGKYLINNDYENDRRRRLQDKFNRLKKN